MTYSREEMDTESCLGRRELNILFLLAARILNITIQKFRW